jgi:hypothetical protein
MPSCVDKFFDRGHLECKGFWSKHNTPFVKSLTSITNE